ncbi:glycosyl hydrolase family 18 protein [Paenibacillus sp. LHD-117]|uniref:glycosyl hydrolase family 18 protein n=1 Tax=Paenibacillus sp. LHD-117 TaxID=3071412 RepID=UPI0027DF7A5F|nr:glycosyl hydrolase family 18 protein [Paenibacillus sp. LHD-117]MDQ6419609.1 glycosyl hydrolase family 18 protein [Paenibacillus sp. LHD-117]
MIYAADEIPVQVPEAPQNLRVDTITATSATIQWDHVAAKNDIDVWHAEPAAGSDGYFTWGNSGSRTIENLQPNTTYKLYVTWFERPATRAHKSNIIEFTTLAGEVEQPPAVGPKNLKVKKVTHNTVELTWDPSPTIKHYWIWDQNNKYIFWANDGAQTVGGLTPNTTYSFYVGPDGIQAANLMPEQKSNLVTFTTLEDTSQYKEPPLTPPQNLKVTGVTPSSVTFAWGGSPGADGYDFYANNGWVDGVWDGSNKFTYTVPESKRTAGTAFTFFVGAQDSVKKKVSANSNTVKLTWGELAAPQDLQVVTANRTTVALGWAPTPGAAAYDVYQDGELIGTGNSNRYTATGLTEGQSFSFTVKAKNALWQSPASDPIASVPGADYTNVTYYTSWSLSEEGRNFKPTDIDVSQITHINYAFADLCWRKYGSGPAECQNKDVPLQSGYVYDGEVIIGDPEFDLVNFESFAAIKETDPHLKLLVSVGGWSWSNNFSNMAASEVTRRAFADSAVKFIREYGLDGLDIDWEYPVEGGEEGNVHSPDDDINFTKMMHALREAFDAAGSEDGRYYLITIASAQGDNFVVNADLANSSQYLDFINIMAYDYSGSWELLAHHNAPLYYDKNHPRESAARANVSGGVNGHLGGGVPAHKLVMGIPFYGKGWSGCAEGGQYQTCTAIPGGTWEAGVFDVADIENNYVGKNGYVKHWNEASKTAYLWNSETGTFITYNDETSMKYNASFVKSLNLAGVMSWEVSGDRNRTLQDQLAHDLPINGTVNDAALKAPTQLEVVGKGRYSAQLKWTASEGADAYEVYANRQYIGTTAGTLFTVEGLKAGTHYSIYVLAVAKDETQIDEVSPASIISVTTDAETYYIPPAKDKNELDAKVTKQNDGLTIEVSESSALATIKANDSTAFKITADASAGNVDVLLPKAVAEALAAKGEDAQISIVWGDITYVIPAGALDLGSDIRISLAPPASEVGETIDGLAGDGELTLLVDPMDFQIAKKTEDGTYEEVADFGGNLFRRIFTLDGENLDADRLVGVLYLPESGEFRPVATIVTENEDGTVTVELLRDGNSIYAIVESEFDYEDVTMDWAREAVEAATASLLISGNSATEFGASDDITRAEFVSMIVKAFGILPDYAAESFADVEAGSEFAGDIAAAVEAGLVTGKTDDTFDPNGTITRQEMAVVLGRALGYAGLANEADAAVLDRFADRASIASYAEGSAAWLVELGILKGVSETAFSPTTNVTKAQATVAVIRLLASFE